MRKKKMGFVSLVGAGPGDQGLITVKGYQRLQEAEVVVYDNLVNPILLTTASFRAEKIFVGKMGSRHILEQSEIDKIVIEKARQWKKVVRLKGGDPYIFGRGGEEASALKSQDIPFEIVPGVTSSVAVPAYAGIPLTHRDYAATVAFVTGHENPQKPESLIDWMALSKMNTLVFLMGVTYLKEVTRRLIECGRSPTTPAAIIQQGTVPTQKTVVGSLGDIAQRAEEEDIRPPSIIVIGEVVRFRDALNWFETRPLFGKRVLVMRSRRQLGELTTLFHEAGAQIVEIPMLEILPPRSYRALDQVLKRLGQYDWILFTSVNGVQAFMDRLQGQKRDIRDLKGVKIATIGLSTRQAVEGYHLRVALVARESTAEGLVKILGRQVKGKKVLIPRAAEGREILVAGLRKQGARVSDIEVYRSRLPKKSKERLQDLFRSDTEVPHWVVFTSSLMVHRFMKVLGGGRAKEGARFKDIHFAAIGPVTRKTVVNYGLKVHVVPSRATLKALVQEIVVFEKKSV
ncbi:MAG: uroporphyrinogen-III C-methyltransferase [Deltaproteobacteria bacterium RIFCSPLOWO2_12_FULL_50_11]|nr:MAG: uroporphyrinogen-III C-methyltransferase [Deltaproteobacteria bacterium RIFCSPLOWO2_12_FULL_50_11]